jgi:hypothetical protein
MNSTLNFQLPNDQLINQIIHQGKAHQSGRLDWGLCKVIVNSSPATALAGVVGTQLNQSQGAGGQIIDWPAKGPTLTSETRRIQYPPSHFIPRNINHLERGVTKL